MSYRDNVEGNELDLSLNGLKDVPVKELAAIPKATHLDLSCNIIQTLPNDFATLTHLVKIDLSRNKLTDLPSNFGNLINLQYLDLDKNELKTVPLSFCRLKCLRWLDLKDNPLEQRIKAIAGDCLDEKQCQSCAKKVVNYMQTIESNLEREKQKKLKEIREKEAMEKAKIEKELEEQRRLKKLEKERRKAESRARNEEKLKKSKENIEKDSSHSETESNDNVNHEEKKDINWCKWFLLLLCISFGIAAYFLGTVKGIHMHNISFTNLKPIIQECFMKLKGYSLKLWEFMIRYSIYMKIFILRYIHSIMIYISNFATNVETLLSVYF